MRTNIEGRFAPEHLIGLRKISDGQRESYRHGRHVSPQRSGIGIFMNPVNQEPPLPIKILGFLMDGKYSSFLNASLTRSYVLTKVGDLVEDASFVS
jgi:hypothetical protein